LERRCPACCDGVVPASVERVCIGLPFEVVNLTIRSHVAIEVEANVVRWCRVPPNLLALPTTLPMLDVLAPVSAEVCVRRLEAFRVRLRLAGALAIHAHTRSSTWGMPV